MAFGQSSGPPATGKQVRELEELLEAAGHSGFRDARGPMGFSQRQAGGKFTRDEADAFIAQLQAEADGEAPPEPAPEALPKIAPRTRRQAVPAQPAPSLSEVPSEQLAAELQRRGWIVAEP